MIKQKSGLFTFIAILFILSGIASLIYQVTWFKHLSYFLGNTTYAQSIVLTTFMSGLAIGAWWWGKKADSSKSALRIFAFLELAIALYCFFYMPIFKFIEHLFVDFVVSNGWSSDSSIVLMLKILVSAFTILIPTILMGGTLPVLVKYLSLRIEEVGKNVAILYFINSLGAVIGTLLCGFYLIEQFGLKFTTYIGASLEVFVGLICLYLSFKSQNKNTEEIEETKEVKDGFNISPNQYRIVITIAALSGLCSMIYEVAWVRLLVPILSSSTYSFTIMLAAFISGITIGSYLIYIFLPRIKNPLLLIGIFQLGIVVSICLTLPYYEKLPYAIWSTVGGELGTGTNYSKYLFVQFSYVFMIMLIPTIFMGMTLPLASRLAVKKLNQSGETIGKIFSINTMGTVIGSLLAGLVLIPFIGIRYTIQFAMLINLILALVVFLQRDFISLTKKGIIAGVVLISGYYYFTNVNSESWAYNIMLSEVPRKINRIDPPESFEEFSDKARQHEKILYYNEGISGTIVVAKNKKETYLFTNGKGDANSVGDLRTQVSLGQTPIILHPSPDTVLVIGYGAGTTIGNVLTNPNVKYAEVAEISSEVIEGSVHFNHMNEKPLDKKNLKVIKDDGVSALRLSNHKYDIIISQPSNPWSAGVGNLFTDEFFRDCKAKLKPGGYVAQWFSLYEMDDKSLKLILRTAFNQFKHVSLWHIGKSDIMLLCSNQPFNFDINKIEKSYNLVSDKLQKIDIYNFPAFLSQQILSSDKFLKSYTGKGPLNTEDRPLLEHWAPQAYFQNSIPTEFTKIDERKNFVKSDLLLKKYIDQKGGLSMNDMLQVGLFQSTGGCKELAYYFADKNPEIYLAWAQKAKQLGNNELALEYLSLAGNKIQSSGNINKEKAIVYGNKGDFKTAIAEIDKAIKQNPNSALFFYQKGTFHLSINELTESGIALEKAIKLDPKMVDAYNNLATVRGKQGDFSKAINLLNQAILLSNKNSKVYFNRGFAKGMTNDFSGAVEDFSQAILLDQNYSQAYLLRGRAYISLGNKVNACFDFQKAKTLNNPSAQQSIDQFCN